MFLTDCHNPNMDGYELTAALRNQEMETDQRLPVVAITANALQGEAERCLASGMDDYLAKPLEMAKLKSMLGKWLPVEHNDIIRDLDEVSEEEAGDSPGTVDIPDDVVVDIKALTDIFGDDMDTVKEILADFIQPSRDIIGEIDAGFEAHSADAVGKAGHKLKSSSRAIGANALADLCFGLEQAGKNGNWDEINDLHPDLHPIFDAVASFIEEM
jgi:HPt (histidine-containing phosphotransfer) domain-containing protein